MKNKKKNWVGLLCSLLNREEGQTLTEYSLILLLIVIVAIVALTLIGNVLAGAYQAVVNVF
jgi:Flp pilus assembly pilin Flp